MYWKWLSRQAKAHGSLILTADTARFSTFLFYLNALLKRAGRFLASFKGITHEISQPLWPYKPDTP
jgi:hypothetical protein